MPALMILGFDLELTRVMLVAVLGGLLGILMMIPLRRAFIVKQHGIAHVPRGDGLRRGAEGRRSDEERAIAARGAEPGRAAEAAPSAPRPSSPASASASSTRPR